MRNIRESKFSKIVVTYLIMMLLLELAAPTAAYALTTGPTQPEFNSFTPISTSDMVDLASGDFNYNIPIMDVGGYPLNLAYNSGVSMDQEASWVGLGWDLSVGQIARQVRGLPDDFNGDPLIYENNMKPNITVGTKVNVFLSPFGLNETKLTSANFGLGIKYNNYDGIGYTVGGGLSFDIAKNLSVGMQLESSSTDGVSASPSISYSKKTTDENCRQTSSSASLGISLNSRKGVESVTMSASRTRVEGARTGSRNPNGTVADKGDKGKSLGGVAASGTLSFNDADFTPSKRVGMSSENYTFALNLEGAVYGFDPGVKFSGYYNSQGVKESEKYKIERGFGYENTTNAGVSDILDFNREKDRTVNKTTVSLPVTNYTYDLYSIQGQGIGGMFRPYRGQVGYVYDNYIQDDSFGLNVGGEIGGGAGVHFGFDVDATESQSSTGLWKNSALARTSEKRTGNKPNYEKVFFKNIGGNHVDRDMKKLFYDSSNSNTKLGGYSPVSFKIEGSNFSRNTSLLYYDKFLNTPLNITDRNLSIIRGDKRVNRGQTIQKITVEEASKFGTRTFSPFVDKKKHKNHTAEIRVIKEGGERYNYARAAYNTIKKEVSFDISGQEPNCNEQGGSVNYVPNSDNTANNKREGDQYFNRITTPSYAHTYLLTSILSPDYQDTENKGINKGPSDGDLGNYTSFTYENKGKDSNGNIQTYKWRIPYGENKANYDEGLKSLRKDNKANYQYGEKELLYIKKIETKTHVAIFSISPRKDGYGVKDENGGIDKTSESAKMWKLDKISLYSKPEYNAHKEDLENAIPIKVAHFEYDYSLCQGVENNIDKDKASAIGQKGKLTLKKIYFTYRNSNMGKYTPYIFNYGDVNDPINNPHYDQRAYDIWGNFKPNTGNGCNIKDVNNISNTEFPYVDQSNKENADKYASAWLLKSIQLPSGGEMELNYESDDYKYVQDREVMQMFKTEGFGRSDNPTREQVKNNILYSPLDNDTFNLLNNNDYYLYIKIDNRYRIDFVNRYLQKIINQPVYFRFLLNMTNPNISDDKYDYVTGYLHLKPDGHKTFTIDGQDYAAIKIEAAKKGDGFAMESKVNPISKAGWYFGRQNLSKLMYSRDGEEENKDFTNVKGIILDLINSITQIVDIFQSPNSQLIDKRIASKFIPEKSWIRLMQPDGRKFGGGSRVEKIQIKDKWDVMTGHENDKIYAQSYGQQYTYTDKEGNSSGVATYEPIGCKENPFVEPFYDHHHKETLLGGDVNNYVEMPFGESFFPSPKITYARVTVKNLARNDKNINNQDITVKSHATGTVVSEFFTSRDYPTISDLTKISSEYDNTPSLLSSLLNLDVQTHLGLSQGFYIHTNDMDGKPKSQWVYPEGKENDPISGMEYKYENFDSSNPNKGKLDNEIITIDSDGKIEKNIVGVDYDVINDFRKNESVTKNVGVHFNTEGLPLIVFIIVPIPLPKDSRHENILKTAVTTKVVHTTGILRETIAYDLGAKVSTKNLAWDANTGDVLLTETVNEYNDKYYNFNFPAYWSYKGMAQSALNIGLEWKIKHIPGTQRYQFETVGGVNANADDYLIDGDELWIVPSLPSTVSRKAFKAWVVNVRADHSFDLIDERGIKVSSKEDRNNPNLKVVENGTIKVIKSGHRNMATASMASVTSMTNPLLTYLNNPNNNNIGQNPFLSNAWNQNRIVNASAIEYSDAWPVQCNCGLPQMTFNENKKLTFEYDKNSTDDFDQIEKRSYNPYLYNVLGNWRAIKSYAYLTGRNNKEQHPRHSGFFNDFRSFYVYDLTTKRWKTIEGTSDFTRWTFASEVSKYNAWGQEVENRDALNRYSSALYGYNNRFPVAVASNAQYKELAFDGFEDYDFSDCNEKSHFSYQGVLVDNRVSITNKQSHTGRKSIRLEPTATTAVKKKIVNCDVPPTSTNTNTKK